MNSAQHCLEQLAECRRLIKSAHTELEAQALKQMCKTWTALAGQIDRYSALLRDRRHSVSADGSRERRVR